MLLCVRDCSGNPFVFSFKKQKIATESPLERPNYNCKKLDKICSPIFPLFSG